MRRSFISSLKRLLGLLALILLLGGMLVPLAEGKVQRTNESIASRVRSQSFRCASGGGTPDATTNPNTGSVSLYCQGGSLDGQHCINTTKVVDCHMDREAPLPGNDISGGATGGTLQTRVAQACLACEARQHGRQHGHGGRRHGSTP